MLPTLNPVDRVCSELLEKQSKRNVLHLKFGGAGQWGNICRSCFRHTCSELGQGKGQQYELRPYGRRKAWVKVAG